IKQEIEGDETLRGLSAHRIDGALDKTQRGESGEERAQAKETGKHIGVNRVKVDKVFRLRSELRKLFSWPIQDPADCQFLTVVLARQRRSDDLHNMVAAEPDKVAGVSQAVHEGQLYAGCVFPLEMLLVHYQNNQHATRCKAVRHDLEKPKFPLQTLGS